MKRILLLLFTLCPSLFAAQPNVVLILADDLGYGDLGVQGAKDITALRGWRAYLASL